MESEYTLGLFGGRTRDFFNGSLGAVLGNALPGRLGVRRTALLGMAILSLATLGMLAVGTGTSPWLTAFVLSGRGFAIGLVIQPILNRLIGSLPKSRVPDGSTLFNIVDRVAGAVGIALIVTFFQAQETSRITSALTSVGHRAQGLASAGTLAGVSGPERQILSHAASAGFHEVILLVAALSLIGLGMALGIAEDADPGPTASGSP